MKRAAIALIVFSIAAGACSEGEPATTSTTAAATTSANSETTTTTRPQPPVTPTSTTPPPQVSTTATTAGVPTTVYVLGLPAGAPDPMPRRSLVELLELVPDTEEYRRFVAIGDIELSRRQLGLAALIGTETESELIATRQPIGALHFSGLLGRPGTGLGVEDWNAEFGFSHVAVDQEIVAGEAPRRVMWYTGRFAAEDIDDAIRDNPVWGAEVEASTTGDAVVYDWGGAKAFLARSNAARPSGEAGLLAVTDDAIIRGPSVESLDVELDRSQPSLADVEPLRSVAERLDRMNVSLAELSIATPFSTPRADRTEGSDSVALLPFEAVGVGVAVRADGSGTTSIVLAHETEATAAENAERLFHNIVHGRSERGFTYLDVLPAFTIGVDGEVIVVHAWTHVWWSIIHYLSLVRAGGEDLLDVEAP